MNRKLLFSVFNTVLKTYSSKLVTVNSYRTINNCFPLANGISCPISKGVRFSTDPSLIATYEEVKEVSVNKQKEILLVDVREPEELKETGVLPGSINIPLGDLECVLKDMSDNEFLSKYGREKPDKHSQIVFSCKSGKRSAFAQAISQQLGYTNAKNYIGGWVDWEEKTQTTMNTDIMFFSAYSTPAINSSVNFEELVKLKDDPNYLLIDVREPSELKKDGSIPGSINIPLNNFEEILTKLSPDDFKKTYGRDKPDKNSNIIFSCRSGKRSADAQTRAIALGFKNAINYSGGWLDWETHAKADTDN